jgi:hypothetical protein
MGEQRGFNRGTMPRNIPAAGTKPEGRRKHIGAGAPLGAGLGNNQGHKGRGGPRGPSMRDIERQRAPGKLAWMRAADAAKRRRGRGMDAEGAARGEEERGGPLAGGEGKGGGRAAKKRGSGLGWHDERGTTQYGIAYQKTRTISVAASPPFLSPRAWMPACEETAGCGGETKQGRP